MKYEWKKQERELYGVKSKPQVISVPRQNYIMIKGKGDPNMDEFSQRVGVLYSLAYPIKMRFKGMCKEDESCQEEFGCSDYAVYPLEGVWSTDNPENLLDKSSFSYTIMIRQPNFITEEMVTAAYEAVKKKKPHPYLEEIFFESVDEGQCIQMLHLGPFDDEPASFEKMGDFAKQNGLERIGYTHHEIYLNDARKTVPEKRKTILRFQVK